MQKLFVYGTLRNPETLKAVLRRRTDIPQATPARLHDYLKYGLNIIPSLGDVVDGYLLEVSTHDMALLDIYEDVKGGLYHKIPLQVEITSHEDIPKKVDCVAYALVNLTI